MCYLGKKIKALSPIVYKLSRIDLTYASSWDNRETKKLKHPRAFHRMRLWFQLQEKYLTTCMG